MSPPSSPTPTPPAVSSYLRVSGGTPPASHTSSVADDIRLTWSKQVGELTSSSGIVTTSSTSSLSLPPKTDLNSNKLGQSQATGSRRSKHVSSRVQNSYSLDQFHSSNNILPTQVPISTVSDHPSVSTSSLSFSFDQMNVDEATYSLNFSIPPLPVELILASADKCTQLGREGVASYVAMDEMNISTDRVMEKYFRSMEKISHLAGKGIVHWGGAKVKWKLLCETRLEAGGYEGRYWGGGVGSRTRAATRKSAGWLGDPSLSVSADNTHRVEGEPKPLVDMSISNDNSDSDGEDWYRKMVPKECRTSQSGEHEEIPSSNNLSPGDKSFFDLSSAVGTITRNTLNGLVSMGSLTITALASKAIGESEDRQVAEAVEPNRGMSGRHNVDSEVEEGTCPMCDKVMWMKHLMNHAPECQGNF